MEVPFPSNLGVLNPCWVFLPKYGRKVNSSLTTTWFSGLTSFVKKNWLLFRSKAILNYFYSIKVFSFYCTIKNVHENPQIYFFGGWTCLRKSLKGNCKNLDEICNLWQVIRVTFWRLPRLTWNEGGVSLRDQGSARRWKGWKMLLGIIMSPRLLLRPEKSSCTALYILLHLPQSTTHTAGYTMSIVYSKLDLGTMIAPLKGKQKDALINLSSILPQQIPNFWILPWQYCIANITLRRSGIWNFSVVFESQIRNPIFPQRDVCC